ncbi:ABC transporter six-transmembrane domain-containing protein, partial [Enterobacter hormaechei subsp. steigerwaltii]|nr:ABC transporter six-transmembrane domain-containing protein [Enterobacter hormaechei subsp. steigerwaltii]
NRTAVLWSGLIIVALITSLVIVTVGNIPFVGLVVPNIISRLIGDKLRQSLPAVALLGASLVLLCDIIGRVIVFPFEIPVSTVFGGLVTALFLWLLPRFAAISENLYFRLKNSLERDNHFIRKGDRRQLYRHYGLLARLRVLISNREAFGYLCVGTAMGILFGFAFVMMTLKGYSSAGHVYSVGTYLWMFAMSLDDVPRLVEQYSNLKDIGQRIEWSERNIKAGT